MTLRLQAEDIAPLGGIKAPVFRFVPGERIERRGGPRASRYTHVNGGPA
jgi:hypothetical protein